MKEHLSTAIAFWGICTFGFVNISSANNNMNLVSQNKATQKHTAKTKGTLARDLSPITNQLPPITFEAPKAEKEELVAINSRTAKVNPQPVTEISAATLDLIREFEGFRDRAYLDTDGTPVIGYGLSKIDGRKVTMGDRISEPAAEAALNRQLQEIKQQLNSAVKVELNENQLGALCSIVFNVGTGFIHQSTLIEKLNSGDYHGAANEFLRWNKANVGGRLVQLAGLSRRRQAEKQLFLTPVND